MIEDKNDAKAFCRTITLWICAAHSWDTIVSLAVVHSGMFPGVFLLDSLAKKAIGLGVCGTMACILVGTFYGLTMLLDPKLSIVNTSLFHGLTTTTKILLIATVNWTFLDCSSLCIATGHVLLLCLKEDNSQRLIELAKSNSFDEMMRCPIRRCGIVVCFSVPFGCVAWMVMNVSAVQVLGGICLCGAFTAFYSLQMKSILDGDVDGQYLIGLASSFIIQACFIFHLPSDPDTDMLFAIQAVLCSNWLLFPFALFRSNILNDHSNIAFIPSRNSQFQWNNSNNRKFFSTNRQTKKKHRSRSNIMKILKFSPAVILGVGLFFGLASGQTADEFCDDDCATDGMFCIKNHPTKFSWCSGGGRIAVRDCPNGLVWNRGSTVCDYPDNVPEPRCPCAPPTTTVTGPTEPTPPPVTAPPPHVPGGGKLKVCYYTNWAQYRPTATKFFPADLDASLCTHIIWAFGRLADNTLQWLEWNDVQNIDKANQIWRAKNPDIKILIAIGGWNAGSWSFQGLVASDLDRRAFNKQAVEFLREYNLDGLDLDWEYPAHRGSPAGDKQRFTTWVRELAAEFAAEATLSGKSRLLLSAAVAAGKSTVDNAYEISEISKFFDFINLMSYDLNGSWNSYTGMNAPLFPQEGEAGTSRGQLTVEFAAEYWVAQGCPPNKLVLGLPLYGRTFEACGSDLSLGASACGAGSPGFYTKEGGFVSFYEVVLKQKCASANWQVIRDEATRTPYMYQQSSKQWISFDDVESIATKVQWAMDKQFAGVMVWAVDLDDFKDISGTGVTYPLMKTINNVLAGLPAPTISMSAKANVDPCLGEVQEITTPAPITTTTSWEPFTGATSPPDVTGMRRVCYYTNWSQYRPGLASYHVGDTPAHLCTHVILAFLNLKDGKISALETNDNEVMDYMTTTLKQQNPEVRILAAIGGWNAASAPFTEVVASAGTRKTFIDETLVYLRAHNLDGLDLDWEYPANRGSPPGDKDRFSLWVKELRAAFELDTAQTGRRRLLLTAAVAAGRTTVDSAYDIPEISKHLDFINVMAYDLNGAWNPTLGHNSPLSAHTTLADWKQEFSQEWVMDYWMQKGAPAHKLVLGVATYGRGFTLCDSNNIDIDDPACGPGALGAYTRESGFQSYYEICLKLKCEGSGWERVWDSVQKVPIAVNRQTKQWIGYDDVESVTLKTEYAKQKGFGGVMIWSLALDDFNDMCGDGVQYPLMTTIKNVLAGQPAPTLSNGTPKVNQCSGETVTSAPGQTTVGTTLSPDVAAFEACDSGCAVSGFYCVKSDPTKFYQCSQGVRYALQSCQSGLNFNYKNKVCDWPYNAPECKCPNDA